MITRGKFAILLAAAMFASAVCQELKANTQMTGPDGVQRINQIWMIVLIDKTGVENVAQAKLATGEYVPLIAADAARLESMVGIAREMATAMNVQMKVIRFTNRTDLQEIRP